MLLYPVYRILGAVVPLVALCSASPSDTSGDDSNSTLWATVPDCARTCVENFITGEYPPEECTSPSNIQCLCRTDTSSGLTIGEAALSCVYALCSKTVVEKNSQAVYHMCSSVSGARLETHATITATTFASVSYTSTADATVTGSGGPETPSASTTLTSSTSTSTTSTSTISPDVTTSHPTSSMPEGTTETISTGKPTSTSNNSTSPAHDSHEKHAVSAATVIGVSVSSGVAGSFIIGVAVVYLCKRWRQKKESEFEIGGAMSEPPGFSGLSSSRRSTPDPGLGPGPSSLNATPNYQELPQLSHAFQPTSQYPPRFAMASDIQHSEQPRDASRIGFAVSSDSDWEASPRTQSSQHTLAELPPSSTAGLYPKPLKWSHRPASGETLFEEDELQAAVAERKLDRGQRSNSPNQVTGLPANPRAVKNGFPAERFLRPENQQPSSQERSLGEGQPNQEEKRLEPPFSSTPFRGSSASNSSSTPNCSSDSSHNTSSNLTTPPFTTAQDRILSGLSPRHLEPHARTASTNTLWPAPEVISRPRIVRKDDIKRVQVRSSPRPPTEVVVPYCPEDFWLERGRTQAPRSRISSELPYPSEACPGVVLYPRSPKKRPQDAPKRVSPTSRNLTPSKRGEHLILSVD
ncbi:uncharacterized protein N7459_000969 [Penicillium hispanicum]|uniref:uncharacterized protein n=1 Tax=Penicillium hispanicum TaxID=1080232 RepID=UPI002541B9D8|nr:uncharacterized protein N7459_000969 [Penicillium hispanicum]KAJ5594761.1 hypothetical protein N7459_000969 [Penicillium hispanicum]